MEWIPVSQRSVTELRAQASEYRRMAEGARTMDAVTGLLRLADRFDALAEQRERLSLPPRARKTCP